MRVKLYAVNYWGSKPGTDDDCWCGYDFESKKEALEQYNAPVENPYCKDHTAYVEIDGPGLNLERRNPAVLKDWFLYHIIAIDLVLCNVMIYGWAF